MNNPASRKPAAPKPHLDGTVVSVSDSTITVHDHDGFTRMIEVDSSTKYTLDGKTSALSAVTKGRFVHGAGTVDSNGTSLDASTVAITTSAPKPPAGGPGGHGPGGPGGHGPGGGGGPAALPKAGRSGGPSAPKPPSGTPSAPSPSSTTHAS